MPEAPIKSVQRASNATGWLLLLVAALDGLSWLMAYPSARAVHDFGVEAARVCYLAVLSIPPLVLASAFLRFVSRRPDRAFARSAYWTIFGLALLMWLFAFGGLFRPTKGRDLFLGASGAELSPLTARASKSTLEAKPEYPPLIRADKR